MLRGPHLARWAAVLTALVLLGSWVTRGPTAAPKGAHKATPRTVQPPREVPRDPRPEAARVLEPAVRQIRGFVRDPAGQALAGARVCSLQQGQPCCTPERCVETDRQGRFTLEKPAEDCELHASARRHLSRRQACALSTALAAEGTITLEPAGAEVSGTVIDATGGTVPGGIVALLVPGGGVSTSATVTDSAGRFVLPTPLGVVALTARADGYSEALQSVRAPASGLTFVLAPSATIPGTVVDASSGAALSGVAVAATSEGRQSAPFSAVTDLDGEFQLAGLEGGVYDVFVQDPELWAAPQRVSVAIAQPSAPVMLRVSRASQIRLTIHYEDGAPCSNVSVFLSADGTALEQFAEDGVVEFPGLMPGVYDLVVRCPGALVQTERLTLGTAALDRQILVSAGNTLAGRVERASGEGLSGVEVNVSPLGPPERSPASCTTDAQGEFSCSGLAAGEHLARVLVGGEPASEPVNVMLESNVPASVVLKTFGLGTIRAAVPNAGTRPPFTVFATSERGIPVEAEWIDAEFEFNNLPLGRYRLSVDAEAQEPAQSTEVTLTHEDQVERVTLPLPATQSIAGRVLDEQRVPVVDASVRISPAVAGGHLAVTDEQGQFSIDGVPPGRYDVRVEGATAEGEARGISAGDHAVAITATRNARLWGTVRGPSGAMATTFLVACEREDGFSRRLPGQEGRWDLGSMQPGRYRVTASSLEARTTQDVLLQAGESRELVLQLSEP